MPLRPEPAGSGWSFDFPWPDVRAGHVHYVTFRPGALEEVRDRGMLLARTGRLDEAVEVFVETVTGDLDALAATVSGVRTDRMRSDVTVEAFNLASAFVDADGLHTDDELWALVTAFGPRMGTDIARATPADLRSAGVQQLVDLAIGSLETSMNSAGAVYIIFGALLPMPTEDYPHWFGLNAYAISAAGQTMLMKVLSGQI